VTIPAELLDRTQWLCWRRELVDGRETKVPYRADGTGRASSTDRATWTDYETATQAAASGAFDGVGFVVTAEDDIVGGDLDGCRIAQTGAIHPRAQEIVKRFATYTEVSPSRCGVRLFGRARLPADHPCRTGKIEVYSRARYFTVTGEHLAGTPQTLTDVTDALHWLFATYFAQPAPVRQRPAQVSTRSDHDLVERALQAANGDRFARLWNGDWQAAGYSSQSEADLGLLSHLAYWCNGDAAQMTRLFEQSGLCRPKWLDRSNYRIRTLAKALAGVGHA
jgi:putative DNA primase/helicase